eukprot:NODE_20198_length_808_cov_3.787078.p3 GENE.NODE_20198_length_808_cov_3.787078~~NODE_20198_length_808_cov_3.787078.p3  ORF type:complete len:123 (-),score=27.97 NODE_20198_length_808_cov_3.787078:353-721(-)
MSSLGDEESFIRLAAIHTTARIAPHGDHTAWEAIAALFDDADDLVRVGAPRAVARIAKVGDADAIARLEELRERTHDDNQRRAAEDAEARLRGLFGVPGGGHPLLGGAAAAPGVGTLGMLPS